MGVFDTLINTRKSAVVPSTADPIYQRMEQQLGAIPEPETGYAAGGFRALARGITGMSREVGDMLQYNDTPGQENIVNRVGRWMSDTGQTYQDKISRPAPGSSEVKRSVFEAVENLPVSLGYSVPSIVGALAGTTVGPGGTVAGSVAGQGLSSALMFRASAQRAYEDIMQANPGIDPARAMEAAKKVGHANWIGESVSNIPEAIAFSMLPGGKAISGGVKALIKPGVKTLARNLGISAASEQLGENWTSYQEAKAMNEVLPADKQQSPWEAVKQTIGPTAVMSLIMGGAGTGAQVLRSRGTANALQDPATDLKSRHLAVLEVATRLNEIDPKQAENWRKNAATALLTGSPIPLDDTFLQDPKIFHQQLMDDAEQLQRSTFPNAPTPAPAVSSTPASAPFDTSLVDQTAGTAQLPINPITGLPYRPVPLSGTGSEVFTPGVSPITGKLVQDAIPMESITRELQRLESTKLETISPQNILDEVNQNQAYQRNKSGEGFTTTSDFTALMKERHPALAGIAKGDLVSALNKMVKGGKPTEKQQATVDQITEYLDETNTRIQEEMKANAERAAALRQQQVAAQQEVQQERPIEDGEVVDDSFDFGKDEGYIQDPEEVQFSMKENDDATTAREIAQTLQGEQGKTIDPARLSFSEHPELSTIGRAFGVTVRLYDYKGKENLGEGFVLGSDPKTVYVNKKAASPALTVLGHELTHQLVKKDIDLFIELVTYLKGEIELGRYAQYAATLRNIPAYNNLNNDALFVEVVGNIVGAQFGKTSFWERMAQKEPSLFSKLIGIAKSFLRSAKESINIFSASENVVRDIEKVEAVVASVFAKYARKAQEGTYQEGPKDSSIHFAFNGTEFLRPAVVRGGVVKVAPVGATHGDAERVVVSKIPSGLADFTGFTTPDGQTLTRKEANEWLKVNRPEVYRALDKTTKQNGLESMAYAHAEGLKDTANDLADRFMREQFGVYSTKEDAAYAEPTDRKQIRKRAQTERLRLVEEYYNRTSNTPIPTGTLKVSEKDDLYNRIAPIAWVFGHDVILVDGKNTIPFTGAAGNADNDIIISDAIEDPQLVVLGHEITHKLRFSDEALYKEFATELLSLRSDEKLIKYFSAVHPSTINEETGNIDTTSDTIEEWVADVVGANFNKAGFWNAFANDNPKLLQRALTFIHEVIQNISAVFDRVGMAAEAIADNKKAEAIIAKYMKRYASRNTSFAASAQTEHKQLTKQQVQAAFKGRNVEETPEGFVVTLPNGFQIRVEKAGEISFNTQKAEEALGRKLLPGEAPVAAWKKFPLEGLIQLTERGMGELNHEVFHAAMSLALSKGERTKVLNQIKKANPGISDKQAEEIAAQEYNEWMNAEQLKPNTLWQKIKDFAMRLKDLVFTSKEGVYRKVGSGRVWGKSEGSQNDLAAMVAAWHGSPHDVDKFSNDKIGTGEGVQAYGWGLYFADSKSVAEFYKNALSGRPAYKYEGKVYAGNLNDPYYAAINKVVKQGKEDAIGYFEAMATYEENPTMRGMYATLLDFVKNIDEAKVEQVGNKGRLYKVTLAPDEDEYLLWDKPLSEQSEKVKTALKNGGIDVEVNERRVALGKQLDELNKAGVSLEEYEKVHRLYRAEKGRMHDIPGSDLYRELVGQFATEQVASEHLHSLGIRGIKYLDGTSRNKGEGNYNYVIFSDEDVSIDEAFSFNTIGKTLTHAQEKLAQSPVLDQAIAFLAPMNRLIDIMLSRKDLAPIRSSIKTLGEWMQKQRTFQDDLLSDAKKIFDRALDTATGGRKIGHDPALVNQLHAMMSKMTLWGIDPSGTTGDKFGNEGTWEMSGMKDSTGLTLDEAKKAVAAQWAKVPSAMQKSIVEMLKANQRALALQKKVNLAVIDSLNITPETKAKLSENIKKRFDGMSGPYFPLSRYGKYVVSIKGDDGKKLWDSRFDSQGDALKFLAMVEKDPKAFLEAQGLANAATYQGFATSIDAVNPITRRQQYIPEAFLNRIKAAADSAGTIDLRKELRAIYRDAKKEEDANPGTYSPDVLQQVYDAAHAKTYEEANTAMAKLTTMVSTAQEEQDLLKEVTSSIDGAGFRADIADRLKDDFEEIWFAALPETSVLKHLMKRKGILGYDQNMTRSFLTYHQKHARAMAFMKYGTKVNRELANIDKKAKEEDLSNESKLSIQNFAGMIRDHQNYMMSEKVSELVKKATKLSFAWYLSSPSAFLVQSSQPFTMAQPFLAARFGYSKAMGAINRAYGQQIKGEWTDAKLQEWNEQNRKLIEQIKDLDDEGKTKDLNVRVKGMEMRDIERLAIAVSPSLNISLSHEAMELIASGKPNDLELMKKIGTFMSVSETTSRKAGFLAAFRLKYNQTGDFAAAHKFATDMLNDVFFDYSSQNRPKLLTGNMGRFFGQFRVFQVQSLFKIGKLFHDAIGTNATLSAEEKKTARKELGFLLFNNFSLAGATGMPLMGSAVFLTNIVMNLFGDDDEPWDTEMEMSKMLREQLGEGVGTAAAKGWLPTLLGLDIAKRIGMGSIGNLFQSSPPEGKRGADLAGWYAMNAMGPAFNAVVTTPLRGAEAWQKGDWTDAARAGLPKPLADLVKAYQMFSEGQVTASGQTLKQAEDFNPYQVVMAALGVNPMEMSLAAEDYRMVTSYSTAISDRRTRLLKDFVRAALSDDYDAQEEAKDAISRFNEKMPKFAFKASDLANGLKDGLKKRRGELSKKQRAVQDYIGGEGNG